MRLERRLAGTAFPPLLAVTWGASGAGLGLGWLGHRPIANGLPGNHDGTGRLGRSLLGPAGLGGRSTAGDARDFAIDLFQLR